MALVFEPSIDRHFNNNKDNRNYDNNGYDYSRMIIVVNLVLM